MIQGSQGRFTKNEVSHNEIWIKSACNAVGGGIEVVSVADSFVIEGNIIRDNAVTNGRGWGGGVGFYDCSPCMVNNIISGNSVTTGGGGLYITLDVKVQLVNCNIIDNQASEYGGGIIVRRSGRPVLMNTIIWNNRAPTGAGIHIEEGTAAAAYCDIQSGWSGTGNINADPLFADTLFHLSDTSPCIGAGIASYTFGTTTLTAPVTDFDNNPRPNPAGSHPDMGAWESVRDIPTGVSPKLAEAIPDAYMLGQNYPNPFNPSTTIEFSLPKSDFVTLKVYDLLGREVATIIADKLAAGRYKYDWDAKGMASGVYLYRLEGEEFRQTRKLTLLR